MNLSTKSRYALMAIIDLIENSSDKPVALQQIAARQSISIDYLEQIFMVLRRQGIVKSVKGPGGGYLLCKEPDKIRAMDIVSAMGERLTMTRCDGKANCASNGTKCASHDFLTTIERNIETCLSTTSLCDVKISEACS
jgi:Rrf2 family iron-sulfur cluster assembly transcriptional regulator